MEFIGASSAITLLWKGNKNKALTIMKIKFFMFYTPFSIYLSHCII